MGCSEVDKVKVTDAWRNGHGSSVCQPRTSSDQSDADPVSFRSTFAPVAEEDKMTADKIVAPDPVDDDPLAKLSVADLKKVSSFADLCGMV